MRKYLDIYLLDCPFEISTTYRYSASKQEASIVGRKPFCAVKRSSISVGLRCLCTKKSWLCCLRMGATPVSWNRIGKTRLRSCLDLHVLSTMTVIPTLGSNKALLERKLLPSRTFNPVRRSLYPNGDEYFGDDNQDCLCETCELGCHDIQPQQNHGSNTTPNRKRGAGQISKNSSIKNGSSSKRVKRGDQSRFTQDSGCFTLNYPLITSLSPRDLHHRQLYRYQWPNIRRTRGDNEIPLYGSLRPNNSY
jgi:hypothetical protein